MKKCFILLTTGVFCIMLTLAMLSPVASQAADKVFNLKAESVYGPMSKTTTVGLFEYLDLVEKNPRELSSSSAFRAVPWLRPNRPWMLSKSGCLMSFSPTPPIMQAMSRRGRYF